MSAVLLVEDDAGIGRAVVHGLGGRGLAVRWLRQGAGVLAALAREPIATVVLDLGLPDADGLGLCRDIRAAGHGMPILMLTARTTLDDRLEGFAAGADDYLPKPFAFAELAARVDVLVRRAAQLVPPPIAWRDLVIDRTAGTAAWQGAPLALEPRSLALLAELALARGDVVARATLVDRVWGAEAVITDNAVDVAVSALRKRLSPCGLGISAVRGQGFRLSYFGSV
ncbi:MULTISPECIES: response regulator transcription factor [unclassified Novosphingobium]|uniref:response regulator transcription factor n=1 Tax=unclassified Novosphingobium TaxID=2644732 RepID=UPI00146E2077|nr:MULTISPECIES: response regulator transcription factor [unclassified Novosphingobium]NMN04441.1 DNA-binding response OmpR family regulator [Novosphingobium sp. SG919]NMN85567.1 DNA-binding response OmpR family regulator [Novosphingobium sp. SG916]